MRHILGLIISVCAPSEDETEPEKDIPPPSAAVTIVAKTITSGGGGCLAGKRRRNTSSLIPSGAREVSVKVSPKGDTPQPEITSKTISNTNNNTNEPHQINILHEAIVCLGYLTLRHLDNQTRLCISGQSVKPLILQLCQLPLRYFSQPVLANILFPTLIACSFVENGNGASPNIDLLASHLKPVLLANFIEVSVYATS